MTLEQAEAQLLQDPEFRKEFEAQAPRWDMAEALVKLQAAAGLSQGQLAERLGTKREYIARIENKPANLTLKTLARIAAAAGAGFALRFEREGAGCIEVRVPAATMQENGTLERFE